MQHIKILDVDMNMNICTCFPVIPPNKNKVMEKSNFLAAVDFQPVEASKFPSPKSTCVPQDVTKKSGKSVGRSTSVTVV